MALPSGSAMRALGYTPGLKARRSAAHPHRTSARLLFKRHGAARTVKGVAAVLRRAVAILDVGGTGGSKLVTALAKFNGLRDFLGSGETAIRGTAVRDKAEESESGGIVSPTEMMLRAQTDVTTPDWNWRRWRPLRRKHRWSQGGSGGFYQLAAMHEHDCAGKFSTGRLAGGTINNDHLHIPNAFYTCRLSLLCCRLARPPDPARSAG